MERLKWDSDFWGINVFDLSSTKLLDLSRLKCDQYLIQALANLNDLKFINELEEMQFKFKESKVTFVKENNKDFDMDLSNFRKLTLLDLKPYKYSFFELYGNNTRYDIFTDQKINDFYYTWLINSISGHMDDDCIGYFVEDQLAGFVTYKMKDSVLIIGLLGIFPKHRGNGYSQCLLNYVEIVAINQKALKIKVSTQEKNRGAISTYKKNGYRISSIDYWYYLFKGDLK